MLIFSCTPMLQMDNLAYNMTVMAPLGIEGFSGGKSENCGGKGCMGCYIESSKTAEEEGGEWFLAASYGGGSASWSALLIWSG